MEIRIQLKCRGKVSVLKQIMKQSYIKHVGSINIGEQVLYLPEDLFHQGSIIHGPGTEEPVIKVKILSAGLRFSHLCFTQSLIKSLEAWKTLPFAPAPALELIVY